jgi:1,4-dihydroxy-2-naphthoyl-CoA hydrolase
MAIWHAPFSLADVEHRHSVGLERLLGIVVTDFGDDWLQGTMPVTPRVHQPMGMLHGGASVVLAESLGSIGANLCVDFPRVRALGQDVNANHLRAVRDGIVTGTARALHVGARSQVWQIDIRDPAERLVCTARLTLAVVAAP